MKKRIGVEGGYVFIHVFVCVCVCVCFYLSLIKVTRTVMNGFLLVLQRNVGKSDIHSHAV